MARTVSQPRGGACTFRPGAWTDPPNQFGVPILSDIVPETSPPDKTWVRLLGLSEKAPDTILAWLLAQGEDIAPIPGTKKRSRLAENLGAINVTLSANDLSQLDEPAPAGVAAGDRYAGMATIDA